MFIVPDSLNNEHLISSIARAYQLLDEHDEAIRRAYQNAKSPLSKIELDDLVLETCGYETRPGFILRDKSGSILLNLNTMMDIAIKDDPLPNYAAYRHIADLGRNLLEALQDKSAIEQHDNEWKSALIILSHANKVKTFDRIIYMGAYGPGYGSGEGRQARLRYMNESRIELEANHADHVPTYSVIHQESNPLNIMVGYLTSYASAEHLLPGGIDNFIPARIAARIEGLSE